MARQIVEPVSDGCVLHNICFVQDVCSSDRDIDVESVAVVSGGVRGVAHLLQEVAEVFTGFVEAADGVEVGGGGLGGSRCEVRRLSALVVVFGDDVDGLDGERLAAVAAEHCDQDVIDDF